MSTINGVYCVFPYDERNHKKEFDSRLSWCKQKVSEYLSIKKRKQYYHVEYYGSDEIHLDCYYLVPQEVVTALRAVMERSVIENGQFKNKHEEIETRREIISDMEVYLEDGFGADRMIYDIDLDDYEYYYDLCVCSFDPITRIMREKTERVPFTDEEYIKVLSILLCAPGSVSLDGLRLFEPEICDRIIRLCADVENTTAIFLQEMNDDVNAILEQCGGRKNTPFIDIFFKH